MGSIQMRHMGEIAKLERHAVDVDLSRTYREIGIRSFGRGIFHKSPVSGATLGAKRVFWIRSGELVLNNVFAWEGAIAVTDTAQNGLIGSHRFMTYAVNPRMADPYYLLYFLLSDAGLELIRRASPGSAGRNRTLGIKTFESLAIPLPDLHVQRRVAAKLSTIRQTILGVQDLRARADNIADALPSSLARRPDLSRNDKEKLGWRRVQLGEVMHLGNESRPVEYGRSYPNVGILSFGRGLFEKPPIDAGHTSAKTLNRIRTGQFIYSRLFAFEGAYASIPEHFDGYYVSSEFPTFDLDPRLDARFLAAYLRSPRVWEELGRHARGLGVRRQRIHPDALLGFEIWLPSTSIQNALVDQLTGLQKYQANRARATRLAAAVASSALHEALIGFTESSHCTIVDHR